MELLRDLWRGDLPLGKTYWLFGFVPGLLFRVVFAYIEYQSAVFVDDSLGGIFTLSLVFFFYAYFVLISVSIWRSANKYQGLRRYPILAKFSVIMGLFAIIQSILEIFI